MIARKLLVELQQLNREEKLEVVRFLNEELSDDIVMFPKGARLFKSWPTKLSPEGSAALRRIMEDEEEKRD